ncbi:hypothetical protein OG585_04005 [Streptomyces sp. NBC_01340]|nr:MULTISPECIES: hypothetical protein [unclassified Streptomyces]MCX4451830.1 hypothetical protein [Streptomyces sp. NBC_01719]MCX4491190.1 hypothetical protein [Streptomyces sp. NBC_01728]WSI36519.1 hypothetical protein OG585_04005 [Streptomyces sp. NBC_01340]
MTGSFACVVEVANAKSAEADPSRAGGARPGREGGADPAEQL